MFLEGEEEKAIPFSTEPLPGPPRFFGDPVQPVTMPPTNLSSTFAATLNLPEQDFIKEAAKIGGERRVLGPHEASQMSVDVQSGSNIAAVAAAAVSGVLNAADPFAALFGMGLGMVVPGGGLLAEKEVFVPAGGPAPESEIEQELVNIKPEPSKKRAPDSDSLNDEHNGDIEGDENLGADGLLIKQKEEAGKMQRDEASMFTQVAAGGPVVWRGEAELLGLPPEMLTNIPLPPGVDPSAIDPAAFSATTSLGIPLPPSGLSGLVKAEVASGMSLIRKPKKRRPPTTPSNLSTTSKAVIRAAMNERVRKLEQLAAMKESALTPEMREAKKRLMILEKNRRAAHLSREKKKRYVISLEDRVGMLAKNLAALELENNQLRGLLAQFSQMPGVELASLGLSTRIPDHLDSTKISELGDNGLKGLDVPNMGPALPDDMFDGLFSGCSSGPSGCSSAARTPRNRPKTIPEGNEEENKECGPEVIPEIIMEHEEDDEDHMAEQQAPTSPPAACRPVTDFFSVVDPSAPARKRSCFNPPPPPPLGMEISPDAFFASFLNGPPPPMGPPTI